MSLHPQKLAVCTPWSSPFMFTDYVDATLNMRHPDGVDVKFFRGTGWCPARRHISACEKALDWGADLICIIGADQVHPEDMLCRLVDRYKHGYEVVAALVPCRGYVHWQPMMPFQPMAWRFNGSPTEDFEKEFPREYRGMELDQDMIQVVKREDGGMQPVNFIGSGVLMFHRDHLLSMERPWFRETISEIDQQRIANMDCKFVWRLQTEADATVWVDTTIMVKHCHVFQIDDTFSERFSDWAVGGVGDKEVCSFNKPNVGQATSGCGSSGRGDGAASPACAPPIDSNPFSEKTATEEVNANV